jgi:hypothetical protein
VSGAATTELVVVERGGVRVALPATEVIAIGELVAEEPAAPLYEYLGQPAPEPGERQLGLRVRGRLGPELVAAVGRVTITAVATERLAPVPALLAGTGPICAIVFGDDAAPLLVLDLAALVAWAPRAQRPGPA